MAADDALSFSTILASSIHDMKNSLGMVLGSLEEIIETAPPEFRDTVDRLAKLQYEAQRVNDNLIQLLTVYKVQGTGYSPSIGEYSVLDFLEENYLRDKPLLDFKEIVTEVEASDLLYWFFDRDLLAGVIANVVNNALRYTDDRLRFSGSEENGWLVLKIEDNGRGFPPHMLISGADGDPEISFESGRTGLGLYFSSLVAGMHHNRDRRGYIEITNGSSLGGGCFAIYLP